MAATLVPFQHVMGRLPIYVYVYDHIEPETFQTRAPPQRYARVKRVRK